MDLVYYEYYPHYMDTLTARLVVPAEALLFALAIDDNELLYGLHIEMQSSNDVTCYFLAEMSGDEKALKNLKEKGWYFGQAEEGSFIIALPEYEEVAMKKLKSFEAKQFLEDEFGD